MLLLPHENSNLFVVAFSVSLLTLLDAGITEAFRIRLRQDETRDIVQMPEKSDIVRHS